MNHDIDVKLNQLRRERRREQAVLWVVGVSIAACLTGAVANARAARPVPPPPYRVVTVQSGDTLWAIARRNTPATKDLRATLFRMRRLNHLSGSLISPGQRLRVPCL